MWVGYELLGVWVEGVGGGVVVVGVGVGVVCGVGVVEEFSV